MANNTDNFIKNAFLFFKELGIAKDTYADIGHFLLSQKNTGIDIGSRIHDNKFILACLVLRYFSKNKLTEKNEQLINTIHSDYLSAEMLNTALTNYNRKLNKKEIQNYLNEEKLEDEITRAINHEIKYNLTDTLLKSVNFKFPTSKALPHISKEDIDAFTNYLGSSINYDDTLDSTAILKHFSEYWKNRYKSSRKNIEQLAKNNFAATISTSAQRIIQETQKAYDKNPEDLQTIYHSTKLLEHSTNFIEHQEEINESGIDEIRIHANAISKSCCREILEKSVCALVGGSIIAASISLTMISFGVLSPLSAIGISTGLSMVASSVSCIGLARSGFWSSPQSRTEEVINTLGIKPNIP